MQLYVYVPIFGVRLRTGSRLYIKVPEDNVVVVYMYYIVMQLMADD